MLTMIFENILTSFEDKVLTITLNRPEKLNALNAKTIEELHEALIEAENNKEIRAMVWVDRTDHSLKLQSVLVCSTRLYEVCDSP